MNKRKIGDEYEIMAAEYMKRNGFDIIERNYRCRYGEIDIIARDGDTLVFTEVKYRKSMSFGAPAEAVDENKQKRIYMTAQYYVKEKRIPVRCQIRFDVVAILENQITVYKDAFGGM